MVSQHLSEVKELVKIKLTDSIGDSNLIEESMLYSSHADSKMIRAGLIFASAETNPNLDISSVITLERPLARHVGHWLLSRISIL